MSGLTWINLGHSGLLFAQGVQGSETVHMSTAKRHAAVTGDPTLED